ncbi:hypothetical protein GCM10010921_13060 [Microbacterium album]|uniref:Holo-[acyl-carrier-protein] synthase n=1 Tax=Microbacterium album TaxID=2053191 RepID=A0A917ID30_9MICO|nr:hypothetical protein GCM10010921_13060 [Microbacterium album]
MIVGIGVDLVDIERFERSMARTPRLRERLFTPAERDLPLRSLAARYAAKEALIKALGGSDGVRWSEIEVAREGERRAPQFAVSGSTAQVIAARGITALHLSLSHDAGFALAYVIAEGAVPVDGAGRIDGPLLVGQGSGDPDELLDVPEPEDPEEPR